MRTSSFLWASALSLTSLAAPAFAAEKLVISKSPPSSVTLSEGPATWAKAAIHRAKPRMKGLELSETSSVKASGRGGERIVKFQQRYRGLPVLNRGAGLSFGEGGQFAFSAVQIESRLPDSVEPTIDARGAADIAKALTGIETRAKDARLVVFPLPSGARLAWLAVPSGRILGVPHAPVVILDAHSGEPLAKWNAVLTAKARVFEANPVSTPNLVEVSLPLEEGASSLRNERIKSVNCIDHKETRSYRGTDIHVCTLEQKARPDANGDFLDEPAPDNEPEDSFSEVSLFHHTNRAYDYFSSLGMADLPLITTVSNLRFAEGFFSGDSTHVGDTNRGLMPFSNAFYVGGDNVFGELFDISGPGLWFGQGPRRDWSYDGDVVYHELGHAVVDHTIQFPLWMIPDSQGLSLAPGAMNEAIADYFSSAIAGDPIVGEYAIQDIGLDLPGIRDLTATNRCPDHLTGEVHGDSLFLSGALWKLRSSLPEGDRRLFDRAVFDALLASPSGEIGYEDFAELLLMTVKASPLGEPIAEELKGEFAQRGILPACERVLRFEGEAIDGSDPFVANAFLAPGTNDAAIGPLTYAPGILQFQVPLEPTGHLLVHFEKIDTGPALAIPFRPKVLIRWGDEPIAFEWSPSLSDNADLTLTPRTMASANSYRAYAPTPEGVDSAYVMIVNTGQEAGLYKSIAFSFDADGDDLLPPAVAASDGYASRSDEGCGCEAPGMASEGALPWMAVSSALALMAIRRRRVKD